MLPLPEEALARLCDQQHDLQERHIAAYHPDAERRMILHRGVVIGRLCLDRGGNPWRIVDVALLPEAQGRGLGSAALRRIFAEADHAGVAIDLHVGRDNPRAQMLYRRLGFVDASGGGDSHIRLVRPCRPATGVS